MSLLESVARRTSFVSEEMLLEEVASLIADSDAGVVGVTREGKIVGTITHHDLLTKTTALGHDLANARAKHVMSYRPTIIELSVDDSDLIDAAITMQRNNAHYAIVTSSGVPIGVISYGVLMHYNLGA